MGGLSGKARSRGEDAFCPLRGRRWQLRGSAPAGPGSRRHSPGSGQGQTPAESGDPASLPPQGGQLEERAVAGGSCGFHEPEERLCRLLRRAPPRTRSCPGSSHHLAAAAGSAPRAPARLDLALLPWPNPVSASRAEEKPPSPRLRRLLLPLAGYFQARSPPHRGILLSISHYGFKVH